jgi:hypothetical protein
MEGDLAEYPIPDLVQFFHTSRKQGRLVLEGKEPHSANVYFLGGEVIHAASPPRSGVDAFYEILSWREGRFAFYKDPVDVDRTIHEDLPKLLLEGLHRLDSLRLIQSRLPPSNTVLYLGRDTRDSIEVRLTNAEWRLLAKVNGRRTLGEIRSIGNSFEETDRLVYGLITAGLVTPFPEKSWLDTVIPERTPPVRLLPQRVAQTKVLGALSLGKVGG